MSWFKKKEITVEPSGGIVNRLKKGLTKTRQILTTDIEDLFTAGGKIDDALFEELEECLITADIGVRTTSELMERLKKKSKTASDALQLRDMLKAEILELIYHGEMNTDRNTIAAKPYVIMVVGVNGVGKTTTIGKIAAGYASEKKRVMVAAADTFRAAATQQLEIWAQRAGADIVKHKDGADPAAVAFDAIAAASSRDTDVVLIDTAGRLHTKVNLMEELKKIKRTIARKIPEAPHEILLVLDATTGQNAVSQAELFHNALGVTSMALTKLDGTARGGVVISICNMLNIQLKYIGIGEKTEDLIRFDPVSFVDALF